MPSVLPINLSGCLEKCSIIIDGKPQFNTDFISKNCDVLVDTLFLDELQRNLILHPGTNLLFIKSLIYYAFSAFIKDNINKQDIIQFLIPGDIVTNATDNRRYKVSKIDKLNGQLVLKASYGTLRLPINQRTNNKIRLYYGKAKTLDGRGIRKQSFSRRGIFSMIFDIDEKLIKNTIDYSFVVVCPKYLADFIMESVLLSMGDNKIKIGELFPAAYFLSSSDSHNYAGNSANVEPVIKFTNRISIARELVLEDEYKRIIGVLINGSDYILSNLSELNDILVRKSLHSVTMISPISVGDYIETLSRYPDLNLYAWTEKALLSTIEDLCYDYKDHDPYGNVITLYKRLNNFCDRELNSVVIEAFFDVDILVICKSSMHIIKKLLPDGEDKDYFLMYGFSLLKLIEQACFPLSKLEQMISEQRVNVISPTQILLGLEKLTSKYLLVNKNIYNEMKIVCEALEIMKREIEYLNPKFNYLKNTLLHFYNKHDGAIAIVLPKNYHCKVFWECLSDIEKGQLSKCTLTTANKYNFDMLYKKVFILSLPESRKFNATVLPNTETTEYICYLSEKWRIEVLNEKTLNMINTYDKLNKIKYDYTDCEEILITNKEELGKLDLELEAYIDKIIINNTTTILNRTMQGSGLNAKVSKMVIFETGECIFLTKYYTPYIYNQITETVEGVDVDSIMVGDTLVFTNIDDENRDIVDTVLMRFLNLGQENQIKNEAYRKSKHWKIALKEYIHTEGLTYRALSKRMQDIGKNKHEVTLRTWLEEDSKIVGPRDVDSFYSIAILTGDKEMLDNPDSFCEACCEIRSMRIQILKLIGKAIVQSVVSKPNTFEDTLATVAGDISQMAQLLQVERIENIDIAIPAHIANKPHMVG